MKIFRGPEKSKTPLTNYQALIGISDIVEKIIIATLSAQVILFMVWSRDGIGTGAKTIATIFFVTLGFLFLNHKGYPREAGFLLFLTLTTALTYLAIHEDGIYNVPFIYFPVLLIFAGIIFGRLMIPIFTGIILGLTTLLFVLDRVRIIVPFDGAVDFKPDFFVIALVILTATGAILLLVMGTIESNLEKILQAEQAIKETYEHTLRGWAHALELNGRETPGHYNRILTLVREFAESLQLSYELEDEIYKGALLHDIGKMGIPDSILLKPGKLTQEEFEISKQHVSLAQNIFGDIPYIKAAMNVLVYHHEQWNGEGYPHQLEGEAIPYSARIFSIIDNWDSLTNRQVYREAWSKEETISYFQQQANKKFDGKIVNAFLSFINQSAGRTSDG